MQRHLEQDLNSRPVDCKPKRLTRCTTVPPRLSFHKNCTANEKVSFSDCTYSSIKWRNLKNAECASMWKIRRSWDGVWRFAEQDHTRSTVTVHGKIKQSLPEPIIFHSTFCHLPDSSVWNYPTSAAHRGHNNTISDIRSTNTNTKVSLRLLHAYLSSSVTFNHRSATVELE